MVLAFPFSRLTAARTSDCVEASARLVPPSPGLLARMKARLREDSAKAGLKGFGMAGKVPRPGLSKGKLRGRNDGLMSAAPVPGPPDLITRPRVQLRGTIQTLVLLVDFSDRPLDPVNTPEYYRQMLFGDAGVFPTGSMREYYRQVSHYDAASGTGIDVQGEVVGWLRLPRTSAAYTNNSFGREDTYPNNAQGMAFDAVQAAIAAGVDFRPYDCLGENTVTALFIIHAGEGAEQTERKSDFWSLKWTIPDGIVVAPHLSVNTFLTVPETCHIGVCAHEWGHLAAQWADYYDTDEPPYQSNGLGDFCLMSSGSWGNNGLCPTNPNGMLRMFHNWVDIVDLSAGESTVTLSPAAEGGQLLRIHNPAVMNNKQYILAEYRRREGQDHFLPDAGLAIYVVDEAIEDVNQETHLAIELIQADNQRDLAKMLYGNRGDSRDLYPYLQNHSAGLATSPALDLPGTTKWSGVTIDVLDQAGGEQMRVRVKVN